MLIIDKELQASGTVAKAPAVFSFYEIMICNVARSQNNLCYSFQAGDNLDTILKEKTFMEPRLVVFHDYEKKCNQGFIIAEQEVLFEVTGFTIIEGLVSLIATYYSFYISYPKSNIAADELLFIQEVLLEVEADKTTKKTQV